MNTERLTILIDVLQNVADHALPFNMHDWIRQRGCGTAACAFGYGALDPRLQAEGLELVGGTVQSHKLRVFRTMQEINDAFLWGPMRPRFVRSTQYSAGAKFFGISLGASEWLFDPIEYDHHDIAPAAVIERIRAVIEAGGRRPRAAKP